ncbi:TylF/MycF/NovP-related O-methyltransferase [Sphingomonas sp. 1P06PA]|uniref:TylF/MycF/NovP-related O-methyltransferase n=1 Tax=Sphingomonas sp. 1P06PA TaxID=554121 RepID=UPI0039A40F18
MKSVISSLIGRLGYTVARKPRGINEVIPEIDIDQADLLARANRYSMTGYIRLWSFAQAMRHAASAGIAGDIVECGVWRGGNLILAALMRERLGLKGEIWGFDTFEGMSAPLPLDQKSHRTDTAQETFDRLKRDDHVDWCYAPIDEVRANLRREVGDAPVRLVAGKVEDTLTIPDNIPDRIAVLRLDTDFYESTRAELETLYPRLSPGGVLIVDDYGEWAGAKQAVDEYFSGQKPWLHYVDRSCRLMIKPA